MALDMPQLIVEVAFSMGAETGSLLQLDDPVRGKLGTGTLGGGLVGDPVWTDISGYVRSGSIKRGASRVDSPIVIYEAGTCSIVLRNEDRRFDPSYLDGPYTAESSELDGTSTTLNTNGDVEAGTLTGWGSGSGGTMTADTTHAHGGTYAVKFAPSGSATLPFVDTAWEALEEGQAYQASAWVYCTNATQIAASIHWYDSTPTFISQSTASTFVSAGTWTRVSVTGIAPAGTTQGPMLITMAGTPPASSIIWIDDAVYAHLPYKRATQVTAMRAVRVRALWDSTYHDLFRGFADEWQVEWFEPDYSECTLTATDGFKVLAGIDRAAVAAAGGGEDSGARVDRILDSADWSAVDRSVATGDSTVQATDLSGDALSELQTVTASELGELYMDGGGLAVFRNRLAFLSESRSTTSQGTFGDGGGEMPYVGLEIASDDATFYNEVRVTRAGGSEQTATDATSQALYYRKTYKPGTDPILESDTEALNYAQWLLFIAADPELRFTQLTINPRIDAASLFPHALGREIGDRITVVRRPPGGGDAISKDQFIRGVEHAFTPDSWVTSWPLQDATRYGSFFVLDHAELGVLDSNALAF